MLDDPNEVAVEEIESSVDSDPSLESPDTEESLPSGEEVPESEQTAGPEAEDDPEHPKTGDEGQGKDDGRVMPGWLRGMKEANPEGFKAAKAQFFDLHRRAGIHPTVQDAENDHNLVESLGGSEGVESMREDAGVYKDASNQFLEGNPLFVKDLWDTDPVAAALHVQPMLDELLARDVEGYKSTIARIWHKEFQGTGFVPALQNLKAAIESGDKKVAGDILDSIAEWQQSLSNIATRTEDPRVKTLLAQRASENKNREQTAHQQFMDNYKTEAINTVVDAAGKVFDSFFKGRKLSQEDRTDLMRQAIAKANAVVMKDPEFVKQRDKHLERRDSAAAKRLVMSRYQRELPNAVKQVARLFGLISGQPPKPQQRVAGQPAPKGQAQPGGYVKINARPEREDIDRRRTSDTDIISKRAVLKDGKKVTWSHLK